MLQILIHFADRSAVCRAWKKNEEVAARISPGRKPVEDVWEGRTWFSDWEKSVPVMVPGNPNRHQ